MSQPVKTMSFRSAMGAKSLMRGLRFSVRLPRRMWPICEREPMGLARPRRTASTPAMSVVATAPMPGIMTPSFPVAGLMLAAASVAAPGVDMLGNTLLYCDFSVRRKFKYLAVRVGVQTDAVFMRALAITRFCARFAAAEFSFGARVDGSGTATVP